MPAAALVKAIHATEPMVVIELAGAGYQALVWLHGEGGSSRTMLEATDHYVAASLKEAVGFEPERFTSPRVGRALAIRAYRRAKRLAAGDTPVAGIGCTATIATDRPKKGEHRCVVALCQEGGLAAYGLTMYKGARSRRAEDGLVSRLILRAVAGACGVVDESELPLLPGEAVVRHFEPADHLLRMVIGDLDWLAVEPTGRQWSGSSWPNIAFLSGAFNPLHEGHRQLSRVAAEILGRPVYFELPVINADKAPLELAEARRRLAQFAGWTTAILSRAPLFSQKARLFPGSVFVLGIDTVERLAQPRFYDDDPAAMAASFQAIREANCRFLVAGRRHKGRFQTLADVALPAAYRDLFSQIPESHFRMDISSTALRQSLTRS